MEDLSSLTVDELVALAGRTAVRRRDALTAQDRGRAGDDLQLLFDELEHRGCRPYLVHGSGGSHRGLS